jgi:hypothetical protein
MSKVLVFNIPAHGHVNPTLAVVQELVARGEEVMYYLTDEFKHKIQSTGVAFRRYEPVARPQNQRFPPDSLPSLYEVLYRILGEGLQSIVPQLLDDVRAEQPDYIIYDSMCLWGKFLAKLLKVRAIAFHSSYVSNEHFSLFNLFASHNSQASPQNADMMLALRSDVEQLCTTYGLQPFEPLDLLLLDEPATLSERNSNCLGISYYWCSNSGYWSFVNRLVNRSFDCSGESTGTDNHVGSASNPIRDRSPGNPRSDYPHRLDRATPTWATASRYFHKNTKPSA